MKVRVISDYDVASLTKTINEFLEAIEDNHDIINITHNTAGAGHKSQFMIVDSVMILYSEKEQERIPKGPKK